MKLLFLSALLVLTCLISCKDRPSSVQKEVTELSKVEDLFHLMNDATITNNGKLVSTLVDEQSLKYYEDLLEMTRSYDSVEISQLGLMDKINILAARTGISDSLLMILEPTDFLILMYTTISNVTDEKKEALKNMQIQNIVLSENFARGELAPNGRTTEPKVKVSFSKENGIWKYNLTSIFERTENSIRDMITNAGLTDLDYLSLLFSDPSIEDKLIKPLHEAWKPPISKISI